MKSSNDKNIFLCFLLRLTSTFDHCRSSLIIVILIVIAANNGSIEIVPMITGMHNERAPYWMDITSIDSELL